ncbi:MAG: thiamine pyrophosphate-binding protein [Afipia felis]|nr:thiamine pyrophosphate-binding protein [Afipia felis]
MSNVAVVTPERITETAKTGGSSKEAAVHKRARAIAKAGSLSDALADGTLEKSAELSLSEALVLGLLKQGVRTFFAIFGHGSTDIANVLAIYDAEGVTRTINCRNEVEMAHAATALRWTYGETPAVITSIGPGALQALAGSLAAASNGVGVYHIYGDETTYGEGYNMQQVPKPAQGVFGRMTADMGESYTLHTPQALREALRRGANRVFHPYKAGPFYLMLPINTQPVQTEVNLGSLPERPALPAVAPADTRAYDEACDLIEGHARVMIKAGGGTRGHDAAIRRLAEAAGAVVVTSPGSTGVLADNDPKNMHVGGSKGSISGNHAMRHADLVIVIGSRAVCQADCSGIGYKSARHVININGDIADATHYNHTTALIGDISVIANALSERLAGRTSANEAAKQNWLKACAAKKKEWTDYKAERYAAAPINDAVWQRPALAQPVAIKVVADFAKRIGAAKYFDAGNVQANGFQIVEDDKTGDTFTESGASYMGFATSALLAAAGTSSPRYGIAFTGDGSFMMNPQILIDAVEHGVHGMVVIFDNRRMAAITSLQLAQYGKEFRTNDAVPVDYVQLASAVGGVKAIHGGWTTDELKAALEQAHAHQGLSVLHVPVYAGEDPLSELGAWGEWNVGNWCENVQDQWLQQDL